uniref:Uncharacterized protein n=1 Tax=Physcomitrium patens TaxID=3218 RepID=A0A7I4BF03_PHYPA
MATKVANNSVAIAMAFAGRSARACDVCATKGAHWFCAADDAYLCTACDTQVHSANALSLRHERVRLSPNGTPLKSKASKEEERCGDHHHKSKKQHPSPAQVLPSRKRPRTSRPYSQHLKRLTQISSQMVHKVVKSEDNSFAAKAELESFDFLETDEFLNDGNQEVPSLSPAAEQESSPCSSDFETLSFDYEFQAGDHSASADSFSGFFKGKAAQTHNVLDDGDQFLVPDTFNFTLDAEMPDSTAAVPADSNIDLAGDAFFFPGDIPGLDGFESFVPDMNISDDFSMTFNLALQNGVEAFEGDAVATTGSALEACQLGPEPDRFITGPFARFFAQKMKAKLSEPMCAERIKSEAKEMLRCCREGEDEAQRVPTLQLNLADVLTAWSNRGEPWIDYRMPQLAPSEDSNSSGSDVGLVPDMDAATVDDILSAGDRDARVLRYKEKRRTRLFSKKIRYEVRKLNAERRPRMKGRFVKRTALSVLRWSWPFL